jgi:hypothetical protein
MNEGEKHPTSFQELFRKFSFGFLHICKLQIVNQISFFCCLCCLEPKVVVVEQILT